VNQADAIGGQGRRLCLRATLFRRLAPGALAALFAVSASLAAMTAVGEARAQSPAKSRVAGTGTESATKPTRAAASKASQPAAGKASKPVASKGSPTRQSQVARNRKVLPAKAPTRSTVKAAAVASVPAARLSIGQAIGLHEAYDPLSLHSAVALAVDAATGEVLFEKNARAVLPIASISKLMTALVVLEAGQALDERLTISEADIDTEKFTRSRLRPGTVLTRDEMLHLALMASENRAANALGRHYPGGLDTFVARMNEKARELGMESTWFVEPTGLSSSNVASPEDLAKLVDHAYQNYPEIRHISATGHYTLGTQRVVVKKKRHKPQVYYRPVAFNNTNRLTRMDDWNIGLSKTGFINEAGHCLVMQADIAQRKVIIVLLDAVGKYNRIGDANRIKQWLEGPDVSRHTMAVPPVSRGT
jgi:D-alanyl-D-alanine endopeptidase (penicillin-binding protein 7)